MIREILTEWRPCIICIPMNGNDKTYNKKNDGQIDQNVHARVVRVEKSDPERLDENDEPVKFSCLAIEHKVVSERDSAVFLIKESNVKDYRWARKRFAMQFEELSGKTLGTNKIGTPLLKAGLLPESVLPAFLSKGVTTVEALAYLSDDNLSAFGPNMRQWRDRAANWVKNRELQAQIQSFTPEPEPEPVQETAPRRGRQTKKQDSAEAA